MDCTILGDSSKYDGIEIPEQKGSDTGRSHGGMDGGY
jgi:hypothetical protein